MMSAPGKIGKPGKWSSKTSSEALTFLRVSMARPGSTPTMRSIRTNRMRPMAGSGAGRQAGGSPQLPGQVLDQGPHGEAVQHLVHDDGRVEAFQEVGDQGFGRQTGELEPHPAQLRAQPIRQRHSETVVVAARAL